MKFPLTDSFQKRCEWMDRIERWHRWFAWCPVRINTWQIAWLETVERRGHWGGSQLGWCFEYQELQAAE